MTDQVDTMPSRDKEHELVTVIMAAGKGTRMKSELPKVLHKLQDKPMIDWVIDVAESINSKEIILVIGHRRELLQDHLQHRSVKFAVQEPQLGTAHAVQQCIPYLQNCKGSVLVLSGDVPLIKTQTLQTLFSEHLRTQAKATVLSTIVSDPTGYGRIVRDEDGSVLRIIEEKDLENAIQAAITEINSGIYIFECQDLLQLLPLVQNQNQQREYYLPDIIKLLVQRGERVSAYLLQNISLETAGVNTVEQLRNLEESLQES